MYRRYGEYLTVQKIPSLTHKGNLILFKLLSYLEGDIKDQGYVTEKDYENWSYDMVHQVVLDYLQGLFTSSLSS